VEDHSFYLFYLLQSHTFIITFVQYTHPSPFAEASLRFLHCFPSAGKTSLGCRAGIWTRACRTAGQRATNWAMLHPMSYTAPSELCCTLYIDSKMCSSLASRSSQRFFLRKTLFAWKIIFSAKNFSLLLNSDFCTFFKSAQIPLLLIPFEGS
jgi:hypothetical protein